MHKNTDKTDYNAETIEKRRAVILREQTNNPNQLQDAHRILEKTILTTETNNDDSNSHKNQKEIYLNDCRDLENVCLQLSEWLVWPPDDLKQWIMVPCPIGKRCLVICRNGRTAIYNKEGRRINIFNCNLSGDAYGNHNSFTILDCIYVYKKQHYYVLDALHFAQHDLINCSAEFRFFWLRNKFIELHNDVSNELFTLLPHYDCAQMEELSAALHKYPHFPENKPKLDGYLFYHKEAYYQCGRTPLVGWLYAFMIPDVLNLSVNDKYKAPLSYKTPMQFIAEFDAKIASKDIKRISKCTLNTEKGHKRNMEEDLEEMDYENI